MCKLGMCNSPPSEPENTGGLGGNTGGRRRGKKNRNTVFRFLYLLGCILQLILNQRKPKTPKLNKQKVKLRKDKRNNRRMLMIDAVSSESLIVISSAHYANDSV